MVALGRPGLLAGLVGGLLGHDLRCVAPPELPPECGARSFDLRGWSAGLLHARVRSPQPGMGLAACRPAPRGSDQQGDRAGCDPCVAVARAPCSNGAGGRCAACSRGGRRRAFAMRGAGRRKRAGYGSGGSGAAAGRVILETLLGDLLLAAPRAAAPTQAPPNAPRSVRRPRRSRDPANAGHQ